MPLAIAEIRDLKAYIDQWIPIVPARDGPGQVISQFNLVNGLNWGSGDGRYVTVQANYQSQYLFFRDEVIGISNTNKNIPGPTLVIRPFMFSHDALCRNQSVGWWRELDTLGGGSGTGTVNRVRVGQPNLQTGQQKVYWFNVARGGHCELSATTGAFLAANVFPALAFGDFIGSTVADTVIDTVGEWRVQTAVAPLQRIYSALSFEGITNSTGYQCTPGAAADAGNLDGIARGGTSHPLGLTLVHADLGNFIGGGAGNAFGARWLWVDNNTGLCVGVLGLPPLANSSSTNTFKEDSIDGSTFSWKTAQFVPDAGSTFGQPKGEIHLFTNLSAAFPKTAQTIVAPEMTFTANVVRNYVAVHDFNPFNVQSGTVRVHNRRRFLGSYDIPIGPVISGGFSPSDASDTLNERSVGIVYHPPSRTYINVCGHPEAIPSIGVTPAVGTHRIIRFRRAPVIDRISKPTPTSEVNENRTIDVRVIVTTDLGDRAAGAAVSFTYYRNSTRALQFNGTTQAATPYVVAAGQIDNDGTLDVRSGASVDGGGTLLTTPGQYTINFGTGTLTPVGSWPAAQIFVRYRHRNVRLTPGHGTLLATSTIADANGVGLARIRYGASLAGELDGIEATA